MSKQRFDQTTSYLVGLGRIHQVVTQRFRPRRDIEQLHREAGPELFFGHGQWFIGSSIPCQHCVLLTKRKELVEQDGHALPCSLLK